MRTLTNFSLVSTTCASLLLLSPTAARAGEVKQFEACGELVQFIECGYALLAEDGKAYLLDDIAPFRLGEFVKAVGTVNTECDQGIPKFCAGIPCLEEATLSPCINFEHCGTIVAAPFCGLALAADTGGLALLDDIGGFGVGDRVFVSGALIPNCVTIPECGIGACVQVALIEPCGESWFSGCGQVVLSFTCGLALLADDGSGFYVLADFGGRDVGDHVFVEGAIVAPCDAGGKFCACIENETIETCIPVGDLNGDGVVDGADAGLLLAAWGTCAPFKVGCFGDLNFDGLIDGGDFGVMLANWS